MLCGEARRAASILLQTHRTCRRRTGCSGVRRKLCLTERTQQCQRVPSTKAWFHDRCNRVDSDGCRRGNVGKRVGDTVRARARSTARDARRAAWKGWRVRVAPPERDPRGCGQRWRELGREQGTARRRAGSTTWTSVGSNADAGPSYRSCTASPQRRRVVTVPSLIETTYEL